MKFLIDMPLSPALATWLLQQNHDAVHVFNLGLSKASDSTIIDLANSEDRVIITADLDYPRLLALANTDKPGIILFRGGNYTEEEITKRLERIINMLSYDELQHSIVIIEKTRMRRKRLPI